MPRASMRPAGTLLDFIEISRAVPACVDEYETLLDRQRI